ncbi:MAG TPA: translocation/assembly module TamB domain-containing protein [Desulfomonilia bacterium]|nr:translocation/assembly module TamB domain-containing protein [Desulfomonilia bacterium]
MKKPLKVFLIALFAVIVIFSCIIGGAHLFLLTNPGQRIMLDFINTLYPGKITSSEVELSLMAQEVSLKNALLKGPDGRQILKAKQIYLTMNLTALLKKNLIFETIYIEEPDFVLELDKDNWLNIESAFVRKTPGVSPFNVYINSLICKGGTFTYLGTDRSPVVRLDRFDLLMDSAFENDATLHLTVPKAAMSLFLARRKIGLGDGSASCTIFNDRISNVRIATKKGSSTATLTGSISHLAKKAQLDCALDINTDMVDIRDALHIGAGNSGRVTGRITAIRDYDNPALAFSFGYDGGMLGGLKMGKTSLEGTLSDRKAAIKDLKAGYASGTISAAGTVDLRQAFPDGYFEGIKEEDAITYDFTITGTSLLLSDLPGMPKGMRGTLSPRAGLKGRGISTDSLNLEADFTGLVRGFSAPALLKDEELLLSGRVSYKTDMLDLLSLSARTKTVSASSQGRINLAERTLDGVLTVETPRLGSLLKGTSIDATGSFKASSRITGTMERPVADITARTEGAGISGISLGTIDMKALLDQTGKLTVNSCTISNRSSAIQAQGSIQVFRQFPEFSQDPAITLDADLKAVKPADLGPELKLAGLFSGHLSASGPASDLKASFKLDGKDLAAAGIRLGDAELNASLSQGLITLSRLALTSRNSTLTITGDARVFDQDQRHMVTDPPIHLKARADSLRIEDFADRAWGSLSLSADMEGTLRHPEGEARITGKDIDLGFQHFQSVSMDVQADGGRFWIEPVVLTLSTEENVNASGWLAMDGTYSFSLGTQGLSLENLDFIKGHELSKGKVFLNAAGEGNLANPTLAGRIAATNIMFGDKPLDDLTFSFELQNRKLSMQGNWNFSLKSLYDLSTGDFSTSTIFAETELSPLFVITGRPAFSGRLTGRIDARGNRFSLKDSDITADIAALDILHNGSMLLQTSNVSCSSRHGIITIPQSRLTFGDKGWLDLKGQGNIEKFMGFDADGVIPVEVLGMFFEELSDCTGLLRVSSRITSQGARPEVTGTLSLENIAYTIPANGQRLHDLNGKVRIQDGKLFFEDIAGWIDTGSFKIGGTVMLRDFSPVNIELLAQTKALPISVPDMLDLTVDSESSLNISDGNPLFKSNVILIDGTYYKDVKVNLITGVIERILPKQKQEREQFVPTPLAFMNNLGLDITIKRRGDVKVENNVADLTLNPDLKIVGTLAKPVMTGRIAVTEGTVTFQNNDFTVSRGVIDFLNPFKTVPTVEIKGETKVRDWTIDLDVEGELDNIQFKLSSTPAEEPANILSLLVVGKTSRELTQNQTGVTVAPTAMAAELLSSTYGRQVKKATTLDILELKASEFSTTANKGENLKLTLGKELSRRITLEYQMETRNNETIQRGIAEYKILENLIINGYQGSDGIFGADLQLKYEFR